MRRILCIILAAMLMLCGCSSSESLNAGDADFTDAASFESALNNGENTVGKTVSFTVNKVNDWSTDRYNLWAGEHLNFVFPKDRTYEVGDSVTVEIKYVEKLPSKEYTSWIINDEKQELSSMLDLFDELEKKYDDSSEAKKEFKEKVIYNNKNIKVTLTGIAPKYSGVELKVLIENNTWDNYTVQCRNFSINGYTLSTVFSAEVGEGKKAVDSITVYGMDDAGISVDDIHNIEFKLHFFDSDSWKNDFDSETIKINL